MIFPLQRMTHGDFAAFQRLMGTRIITVDGIAWRQVRPCFFRPLLPFQVYRSDSVSPPAFAFLGGIQYPVSPEIRANSFLNVLVFENTPAYSMASLHKNPRRQIKLADKEFVIRPISDVDEFKRQAFPVYLSFYKRTRYQVCADRREPDNFSRWAEALFKIPDVLILGGYRKGKLGGVSLSFVVDRALVYATFFCDDESLRLYLSDLMLHCVRQAAGACAGVEQVLAGMYKGIPGLDNFYLLRGAKLMRQRAWLELNPLARLLLRSSRPKQYARLLGSLDHEQIPPREIV